MEVYQNKLSFSSAVLERIQMNENKNLVTH